MNAFNYNPDETQPPAIYDPWAHSLEGTVKPPKGWENLPGGWKLHYRVSQPVRIQRGLVDAMRREIGEEKWARLMKEWGE